MMKYFIGILLLFLSYSIQAQNNYIVKTEDGRRVLLKADYTWEYIDLKAPEKDSTKLKEKSTVSQEIINTPELKKDTSNCNLGLGFEEPRLNKQTQAYLKRNRSSINQLKKKVANGKVAYKRNGASFFRKGKLF